MKNKATMTSSERISAVLRGNAVDRVPFWNFILGFCARNVGFSIASIYNDPEKSFYAQLSTREQYQWDNDPFLGYASHGAYEFGRDLFFPTKEYEQAPYLGKSIIKDKADIDKLPKPDVHTAGMMPNAMEFAKILRAHDMPASLVISGPFTAAGNLCEAVLLCTWMIEAPDLAHRVIKMMMEHLMEAVHYWCDTFDAENVIIQIWEPLSSNQIISPKHFEEFVFPYQLELHKRILALGVNTILAHICGEQNKNLPLWAQIPMGNLGIASFGCQVDISTAIEYFGDKAVIAGNIDPSFVQNASAKDVYEACKKIIEEGKKAPSGFMLMPGCEISAQAPPYNVYSMVKAIDDFGWY